MRFAMCFRAQFCLSLPLDQLVRDPHPRWCIQNLLEPATQANARMHVFSACAGYTQPGGPKCSMRGAVVLHNRQRVSPPPPPRTYHHQSRCTIPTAHIVRVRISCAFVSKTPLLQLLRCLGSMPWLDIRSGCPDTDFGRNIKR